MSIIHTPTGGKTFSSRIPLARQPSPLSTDLENPHTDRQQVRRLDLPHCQPHRQQVKQKVQGGRLEAQREAVGSSNEREEEGGGEWEGRAEGQPGGEQIHGLPA